MLMLHMVFDVGALYDAPANQIKAITLAAVSKSPKRLKLRIAKKHYYDALLDAECLRRLKYTADLLTALDMKGRSNTTD